MDRTGCRRAKRCRVAVQFASFRFHAGLALCCRRWRGRRNHAATEGEGTAMIALRPNARILIVVLRRLGDVLLTTPLIRSVRCAWPDATIEVLAFADTIGILTGNPDIDRIVAMPVRPGAWTSLLITARLARRYDLAISTQ